MFDIQADDYYVGIWRMALSGNRPGDWMCMVWQSKDDKVWHLKYRFRYHVDENVFESQDERSWYSAKMPDEPGAEAKMIKAVMTICFAGLAVGQFTNPNIIWVKGPGSKAMEMIRNPERPGFASAVMTEEQFEEYRRTNKLPEGIQPHGDYGKERP